MEYVPVVFASIAVVVAVAWLVIGWSGVKVLREIRDRLVKRE